MLELEYENDSSHYIAMQHFLNPDIPIIARCAINQSFALWTIALLCGAYMAYVAQSIAFMAAFLLFLCSRVYEWTTYPSKYWAAIEKTCQSLPVKRIRLQIAADGLHETVSGIESFAPWTSVKSFAVFRDILFVELAVGLWSIIPKGALSSTSATFDQVEKALADNGVARRDRIER